MSSDRGDGTRRVTFNLSESAFKALEELSRSRRQSMTDVVKNALGTEKFLTEETESGSKILLEDKKGRLKQIVLR